MITATVAKLARTKLGLSQAAVAKATGIPRNIMSAFELQKIVMLDDMQSDLVAFFESNGVAVSDLDASNDSHFVEPLAGGEEFERTKAASDLNTVCGIGISEAIDSGLAQDLLLQVREIEEEISQLLPIEVEDVGIFFQTESRKTQKLNHRLIALHAKWACLVRQLHGSPSVTVEDIVDGWPDNQAQLLAQNLDLQSTRG